MKMKRLIYILVGLLIIFTLTFIGCKKQTTDTSPFKVTYSAEGESSNFIITYSSSLEPVITDTVDVKKKDIHFHSAYEPGGKYFTIYAHNLNPLDTQMLRVSITIDGTLFKTSSCHGFSGQSCAASGTYIRPK